MQASEPSKNPHSVGANPFLHDVYQPGGITELPGVADLHASAMTRCVRVFEELVRQGEVGARWGLTGRTLLIAAPRAGYGKSHLVARLESVTGGLVATLPLPFDPARPVTWEAMLQAVLRHYGEKRCSQHPCTLLDEAARYFAAQVMLEAAKAGALRPGEMPADEASLSTRFRAAFDPATVGNAAAWFVRHGGSLLSGAARTLERRWEMRPEILEFWCEVVQAHFSGSPGAWEGLAVLKQAEARDALCQFLRFASECRSVAFVVDHLDGFFGSTTAGMQIAEVLTSLRQGVPRSVTLLCLNRDVWDSIFEGRIPSAWVDRLTGETMMLGDVPVDHAGSLVRNRLTSLGQTPAQIEAFWDYLARREQWQSHAVPAGLSPREVLRRARPAWEEWLSLQRDRAQGSSAPGHAATAATPVPATVPPPVLPEAMKSPRFPKLGSIAPMAPVGSPEMPSVAFASSEPKPEPAQTAPPVEAPPITVPSPAPAVAARIPAVTAPKTSPPAEGGLRDIEAIIAEIRRGGRAVSDTRPANGHGHAHGTGHARPANGHPTNGHGTPHRPPAAPVPAPSPAVVPPPVRAAAPPLPEPGDEAVANADVPAETGESPAAHAAKRNPFWGDQMSARLEALHREVLGEEEFTWDPQRLYRLIRTAAPHLSGLSHSEQGVSGGIPCLAWESGLDHALIGFAPLSDGAYWTQLVRQQIGRMRNARPGSTAKVIVLSHRLAPFLFESLRNIEVDRGLAMRLLDPVEINDTDLARLYASERLLAEAGTEGRLDEAARFVARHLENFWRRLLRPSAVPEPSLA